MENAVFEHKISSDVPHQNPLSSSSKNPHHSRTGAPFWCGRAPRHPQESPREPRSSAENLSFIRKNYRLRRSHLLFPIKNPLSASSRTHTILARELRFDFTNGFFYVGLILAFMTQEAITAKTSVLPKRNHGLRTNMSLWQKVEGKNSPRRWKKCTPKKQIFVHAFLASEPPKNFSFAEAKP